MTVSRAIRCPIKWRTKPKLSNNMDSFKSWGYIFEYRLRCREQYKSCTWDLSTKFQIGTLSHKSVCEH